MRPSLTLRGVVVTLDMPFTPFHFGPGALLKSFLRHRFSFVTFVASQVVIDFETLNALEDDFFEAFSSEGDEQAFKLFNALEIYIDKRLSSPSWRNKQDPNVALWEYVESKCK